MGAGLPETAGSDLSKGCLSMRETFLSWPKACGDLLAAVFLCIALTAAPFAAHAQTASEAKPYDDRLNRLSEILGAVHYLRELCEANDGQTWRDRMRELLDAEGSSALRRARMTRSFNQGYNSYSRTYRSCTPSAQTTISRFLAEGVQISDTLVRTIP